MTFFLNPDNSQVRPFSSLSLLTGNSFPIKNQTGGGGGGGGGGASSPLGPVEPDTSSLWMDLFSLDSLFWL